jgi:hypothetical protein
MIRDESMIVNFENVIQRFYDLEYAVRVNIEMLDQFNKWANEEIAIQRRDELHINLNNIFKI